MFRVWICRIVFLAASLLTVPAWSAAPDTAKHASGQALYEAGKIDEARKAFQEELAAAEDGAHQGRLWQALMGLAWFHQVTGNFREAIPLSNRALEIATKADNGYMLGRSLSWLGWNYSSMGLYELALKFYEEAVHVGAPDGKIQIVPVWGLATQELGALWFRMGDTKAAKLLLEETTNFARERGIDVGIAEGGAHLAEIALHEGELDAAERLADEAVEAAVRCGCSHLNTARARLVRAKVAIKQAGNSDRRLERARGFLEEALRYADEVQSLPTAAEARLLLAELLPREDHDERIKLVEEALRTLEAAQDERRGLANSHLGREYLAAERPKLAAFYINHGVEITEDMFRKVDRAYVLGNEGELQVKLGSQAEGVEKLRAAIDAAHSTGNSQEAAELARKLAVVYEAAGFDALALERANQGRELIEKLLKETHRDREAEKVLEVKRVLLLEFISRLELRLVHTIPAPG